MENEENKIIPAGTKVVIKCETGECGSESADFYIIGKRGITEETLNDYCWELAVDHASGYGIYPEEERPEDYDEDDVGIGSDTYSWNIEGYYEIYNPDEHDGLRVGNDTSFREI